MKKDPGLERAHEEERGGARAFHAHDARRLRAAEVAFDQAQPAAGRAVLRGGVEGDDHRRGLRVHVDGDVRAHHLHDKGDEAFRDVAQDDARIGARVDCFQLLEDRGERRVGEHRLAEELLLGGDVAEDRRGRDLQRGGDVGQRRGFEALRGEDAAGFEEEPFAGDGGRASHL